jgi:acetyl-CoA synthase
MSDIKNMVKMTTRSLIELAQTSLESAIKAKGADAAIGFEGTAFYLPLACALLGLEIKSLGDARDLIRQARQIAEDRTLPDGHRIPYLDGLLADGLATLLVEELLAALTHAPQEGFLGFVPDTVLRALGVQLVDGRIAGIAVLIGKARDIPTAVNIVRDLQSKNIIVLLIGNKGGESVRDQLIAGNVELGLDNYIVPLGPDELSAIYAVNFAIRAALSFGNCKGGQGKEILTYCQNRVHAFLMVLGKLDEVIATTGLGVLNFGFPIVTDQDAPETGKIETTRFEAIVVEKDPGKIVARAIETRGIKIKVVQLPIPVLYGPAFVGERVRRENCRIEFGGKYSTAFEFLTSAPMDETEDGLVAVVGPEIDETDGRSLPLGIFVEVSARNFNKDFEPILERQIHRYINEAQGVMHMGQRDMIWVRISQEAYGKGFRLKHFGVVIHAMLHRDFGAIIDKVQVTLFTRQEDVDRRLKQARDVFDARDERLRDMTDEAVDTFYSCALCQSFAPNHLCIITPERLGLCGAYSWLDAKAAHEITPTGGNQPIKKGVCLDAKLGQWKNINEFLYAGTNKTMPEVSMYSILVAPQSSCGCFECIVALVPEVSGVLVVSRDFPGMTPLGMNFTQLAGSVGGGVQTPGFIGVGKLYLASKKFISAEGGLSRLVWMPKDLKDALRGRLEARAQTLGLENFLDKVADETTALSIDELVAFLKEKGHPVLKMSSLI